MLHVAVDAVQLDRHSVKVKDLVAYLCLLEPDPAGDHLNSLSFRIDQFVCNLVQIGIFGRPFCRISDHLRKIDLSLIL